MILPLSSYDVGRWIHIKDFFFLSKKKEKEEEEDKSMQMCIFPWNEIAGVYFVENFRDSY